jgi:hypothetical protein
VQQCTLNAYHHTHSLDKGQHYGEVACILGDLFAAFLAFFFQTLQVWNNHGQELHDDGCVDVWRDAHGKDGKILQGAAGNDIEEAKDKAAAYQFGEFFSVYSRHRDMGAQPENKDHGQGKQKLFSQL